MNGPANGEKKKRKKEKKKKGDREGRKKQKLKATGNCWWASHLRDTLSEGPQNASGPSGSGVGPLPTGNGTGSVPGGARGGEEEDWFQHLTAQERAWRARRDPSYGDVDVFHVQAPEGSLHALWTAAAKKEALLRKDRLGWESEVLSRMMLLVRKNAKVLDYGAPEKAVIDFDGFNKVRSTILSELKGHSRGGGRVEPSRHPFMNSSSFYRLPKKQDNQGAVLASDLSGYLSRKVGVYRARVAMGRSSEGGAPYLTEAQLQEFIEDIVEQSQMTGLATLPQEFRPFYLCMAVRRIRFFLDPHRRGRVNVDQLVKSPVLVEFMQVVNGEEQKGNWFSAKRAMQIYDDYIGLQTGKETDGMLSPRDLYNYDGGKMSRLFIDRYFDVTRTYSGLLDFKGYIEFIHVVENPGSKVALDVTWRCLDVEGKGTIYPLTILTFYREIARRYPEMGVETLPPKEEDAVVEIFDIIGPEVPFQVRKRDLENCPSRETAVGILGNARAYHAYENRESLPTPTPSGFAKISTDLDRAFRLG